MTWICNMFGHRWRYGKDPDGKPNDPDHAPYEIRECRRCGYLEGYLFTNIGKGFWSWWGLEFKNPKERERMQWMS